MSLTDEQIEHFRQHGYVAPIDVMSADEATELRRLLEVAEAAHPDELHAENRNNPHLVLPFFGALSTDPRIVDYVEALVGPDIMLWSTVLFAKAPHSGSFVSWHQDSTYMAVSHNNDVTAWLALTPSTLDNGCVSVIPGTHKSGKVEHVDTFGDDNILTRGQEVQGVDPNTAVHLELKPGQMSLHHPWVVHGSQPNRSDDRRIGLALQTFMGADMRPSRGPQYVTHVRGAAIDSSWCELSLPTEVCSAQGLANRDMANQAFADILYDGAERRRKL